MSILEYYSTLVNFWTLSVGKQRIIFDGGEHKTVKWISYDYFRPYRCLPGYTTALLHVCRLQLGAAICTTTSAINSPVNHQFICVFISSAVFVCWLFGLRVVKMHGFRLTWNRVGPHVPRARYIANGSVTPTPSGCSTLTTASGVDGREPPPQLHHISVSDLVCRYVEEEAEIVASTPAPSVASSGTPDATEPGGGRAMSVSLCIPTKDTCFWTSPN